METTTLMSASNSCLEAFSAVVRSGSFSLAARQLRLTQPALSLRIKQLEETTGQQLVRRGRKGIALTPAGQRLLEYVKLREIIDREAYQDISGEIATEFSGQVRIAGHFSIINHFVVPALATFLRENPQVQLDTIIREDDEVPRLIEQGECELALVQRAIQKDAYESRFLGEERYVLIRSTRYNTRLNVFLDSHVSDVLTDDFLKIQKPSKRKTQYSRSYFHNETGIVRAVELGLGQAVVAERELLGGAKVRKVAGYKSLGLPAFLQYSAHAKRSKLLSRIIEVLLGSAPSFLST
ncbi:MAG: hypothetical protein RL518_1623 [Pseudomonadota bacterium]|jgi:DNA-binding transcriptional LysR family regulator